MAEEGEEIKKFFIKFYKQIILFTLAILLTLIGLIYLTSTYSEVKTTEHEITYTSCITRHPDYEAESCFFHLSEGNMNTCNCKQSFNLTTPLNGEVVIYYEMTDYDQTSESYVKSRDDNQLKGVLGDPSKDCEPYRYEIVNDVKVPIAPCGAIANSMVSDSYSLHQGFINIPLLKYGMLTDEEKAGYHNPDNLKLALKNFTKPKNWLQHIWELDSANLSNNGFQNEKFISWMRTDWKRKHFARIDHSVPEFEKGLPSGVYDLFVNDYASPKYYNGTRKVILVASEKVELSKGPAGVVLLTIGLVTLAAGFVYFYGMDHMNSILEKINRNRKPDNKPSASEEPNEGVKQSPLLENIPASIETV